MDGHGGLDAVGGLLAGPPAGRRRCGSARPGGPAARPAGRARAPDLVQVAQVGDLGVHRAGPATGGRHPRRAASVRWALRPTRSTSAPRAASRMAAARPRPQVAPVTTTSRPVASGGSVQWSVRAAHGRPKREKLPTTVASRTASTSRAGPVSSGPAGPTRRWLGQVRLEAVAGRRCAWKDAPAGRARRGPKTTRCRSARRRRSTERPSALGGPRSPCRGSGANLTGPRGPPGADGRTSPRGSASVSDRGPAATVTRTPSRPTAPSVAISTRTTLGSQPAGVAHVGQQVEDLGRGCGPGGE